MLWIPASWAAGEQAAGGSQTPLQKAFHLLEAGQWDAAIDAYRQARQINPYDAQIYINLSYIYLCQQKHHLALLSAVRAVDLAPNRADAWINLGIALYRQKRLRDAILAYERALELAPNDAGIEQSLRFLQDELLRSRQPQELPEVSPAELA